MRTFGLGRGLLALSQLVTRRFEPSAGFGEFIEQLLLEFGDLLGFGVQLVGIASARHLGLGVEQLRPVGRDPHGRADALGQRRRPEPGLLSGLGPLRQVGDGRLVRFQLDGGGLEPGRHLIVFATQEGLGLVGVLEFGPALHQVVGRQSQSRVPQVGLDGRRAPGHLGLSAERFELTAQFRRQVGEPSQVGGHRIQLADGLFLAFAVLEHPGGFLDERAPVLGARFEDLRKLALPDDDVHFPADTGIGQQFLHVHQPATAAVDLVLTGPVAKHPAGDGHL